MAELNQQQVVEYIKGISVLELSQLVKALETELGVSAAAAMPMAMPAGGGGAAGAAAPEEKTEFTATLTEVGSNKINVIKVVREVTSLGLKEAKDLVEGAPKPIKEGIPKDEAVAIQTVRATGRRSRTVGRCRTAFTMPGPGPRPSAFVRSEVSHACTAFPRTS